MKIVNENGIIHARIITPGHGTSGYYSPQLLEKTAPKFDGAQVYWDHPTSTEEAVRPERSLRDLAGKVQPGTSKWESAGKEGPGVYADVEVFKPFRDAVNELGPHIGLSIRASGQGQAGKIDGKSTTIIESIDSVQSVDFVTLPGRGGKILQMFEAARPAVQQENEMDEAAIKKLVENAVKDAVTAAVAAVQSPVKLLEARALKGDAIVEANRILGPLALHETTKARIVAAVSETLPLKEGALDVAKFTEMVTAKAKEEAAYLGALTGSGVTGMGSSIGLVEVDEKALRKAEKKKLKEAKRLMRDEDEVFASLTGLPVKEKVA